MAAPIFRSKAQWVQDCIAQATDAGIGTPSERATKGFVRRAIMAAKASTSGTQPPRPQRAPTPAKPAPSRASSPPPAQRPVHRRYPKDIPAAMNEGLSNTEIHRLVKEGRLARPKNIAVAVQCWNSSDVHEAQRRGLIW